MKVLKGSCLICLIIATVSLILGIVFKLTGIMIFALKPLSYLRFTTIMLLYVIALGVYIIAISKSP